AARMRARLARLRLRPQQARYGRLRVQGALGSRADAARIRILPVPPRRHPRTQSAQSEISNADGSVAAFADRRRKRRGPASGQGPRLRLRETMESLLFLAHRLPYPPNKGDKVRSYHMLQ